MAASDAGPSAAAPRPTARATRGGPATVQIGAFGSSDQAFKALDDLGGLVPELLGGRSQQVTPATVNGSPVFRAVVGGFAARPEAEAFCAALTQKGRGCLVR